ncbi:hypothetical protein [Glutamicibacter arilaitensis]|uniref:hypothetical protein n=1 Tax=Glutamicibacter arilaitensis TaxID=256701 RepID=UPI003F8F669C
MGTKLNERKKKPEAGRRWGPTLTLVLVVAGLVLGLWLAQAAGWFGAEQQAPGGQKGPDAATMADLEAEQSVPPVLSFEDSKPSDWPEGDTTGCGYVHEQFQKIADDVDARGLDGMRTWLAALDELEADPQMDQYAQHFMEIKREWSTVLAAAESEGADSAALLDQGKNSLTKLSESTGCQ